MLMLAHITFTGSRVALMLHAIALGATPFGVGVVVSLLAVLPMLLSVHAGRWTDRTGIVKPVLAALAMMVAGGVLPAVWPSLPVLGLASVLMGTGFMVVHLAINNEVGHATTPENRTAAFSLLALGFSTSTVLGPIIAGSLIDFAGHAAAFLALAAFSLAALGVLRLARRPAQARAPSALPANPRVADLLRHPPLRAVFIASGMLSMAWDLFTFMVPIQGARLGLSASTIGFIMGAFGAGTFIIRLIMPRLGRKLSEWRVLTGALIVTAGVYLLFPLFTAVPVLMGLALLLGLGLGSALPMILSVIHRTAPEGRTGEAIGVRSMLINTSQTVLPVLFGALGAALGTIPVFWTLAAILGWGSVFAGREAAEKT